MIQILNHRFESFSSKRECHGDRDKDTEGSSGDEKERHLTSLLQRFGQKGFGKDRNFMQKLGRMNRSSCLSFRTPLSHHHLLFSVSIFQRIAHDSLLLSHFNRTGPSYSNLLPVFHLFPLFMYSLLYADHFFLSIPFHFIIMHMRIIIIPIDCDT